MRRLALASTILGCLVAACVMVPQAANAQMGLKGPDLQRIGQWLTYNGLEMYRLEMPHYASPYAVALTGGHGGWRLVVFLRDGGETNVDWDSGPLRRPFQAASTDSLVLVPNVGKNFGVTFTGCKAQDCSNVYGALLYLPWSHQVFEKDISGRAVSCTATLLDPANRAALDAVDAALKRQKAADPHYVPPGCPGAK